MKLTPNDAFFVTLLIVALITIGWVLLHDQAPQQTNQPSNLPRQLTKQQGNLPREKERSNLPREKERSNLPREKEQGNLPETPTNQPSTYKKYSEEYEYEEGQEKTYKASQPKSQKKSQPKKYTPEPPRSPMNTPEEKESEEFFPGEISPQIKAPRSPMDTPKRRESETFFPNEKIEVIIREQKNFILKQMHDRNIHQMQENLQQYEKHKQQRPSQKRTVQYADYSQEISSIKTQLTLVKSFVKEGWYLVYVNIYISDIKIYIDMIFGKLNIKDYSEMDVKVLSVQNIQNQNDIGLGQFLVVSKSIGNYIALQQTSKVEFQGNQDVARSIQRAITQDRVDYFAVSYFITHQKERPQSYFIAYKIDKSKLAAIPFVKEFNSKYFQQFYEQSMITEDLINRIFEKIDPKKTLNQNNGDVQILGLLIKHMFFSQQEKDLDVLKDQVILYDPLDQNIFNFMSTQFIGENLTYTLTE